jgi:hypothetical protein
MTSDFSFPVSALISAICGRNAGEIFCLGKIYLAIWEVYTFLGIYYLLLGKYQRPDFIFWQ